MWCFFEGGAYLSNYCNLQLKSLLHLGQNAITFRTLLHLGLLHLQRHPRGMAQTVKGEWIHDLIKRTPPRFGQFFIASFKKEKIFIHIRSSLNYCMKRFLLKPLPIQRLWKNITTVQHWDLSIWLGKSVLITFQNIITLDTKWRECFDTKYFIESVTQMSCCSNLILLKLHYMLLLQWRIRDARTFPLSLRKG